MTRSLKKLLWFALIFIVFFTATFLALSTLGIPLLEDPSGWMQERGAVAAGVSTGLLTVDVLLPVPSSFLMTANGRLFGVLGGTAISLTGYLLGAVFGYLIGRYGERWFSKMTSADERLQADAFMGKWGMFSVVLSRPIPILAETVAICAGATRLKPKRFLLSALAGSAPICLVYAVAGARATDFRAGLISLLAVIALSGLFWLIGRRL